MGLDMYLNGKKHNMDFQNPVKDDSGYPIMSTTVELGYWRKHPDLHGFIVKHFADGEDNCEPIDLTSEDIDFIIKGIEEKNLPHTDGFFFGQSFPEDDEPSLKIFKEAKEWLNQGDKGKEYRTVYYRASW